MKISWDFVPFHPDHDQSGDGDRRLAYHKRARLCLYPARVFLIHPAATLGRLMKDSGDSGSTAMLTTVFPVVRSVAGGREATAQDFLWLLQYAGGGLLSRYDVAFAVPERIFSARNPSERRNTVSGSRPPPDCRLPTRIIQPAIIPALCAIHCLAYDVNHPCCQVLGASCPSDSEVWSRSWLSQCQTTPSRQHRNDV